MRRFAVTLIIFAAVYLSQAKRYNDYLLYNLYPETANQYDYLQTVYKDRQSDIIFPQMPPENEIVQVLLHKFVENGFLKKMELHNIKTKKLSDDFQQDINKRLSNGPQLRTSENKKEYFRSLSEVYSWLVEVNNKYPYTRLESIGKSIEDRDIYVFAIEIPPRPNYNNLKGFIEGGIHGNEWLSTATVLHMIENILTATSGPYAVLKRKYFLYFIPVLNPDGYEYSQKEDPLWKKNRRSTGGKTYGVNLNRNFNYKFSEHDVTEDLNSDNYPGPYAFSEPETIALRDYLKKSPTHVAFYFALHGHGQKVIIPYGDSTKHVVNYHEVQKSIMNAISLIPEKTKYDIGTASEVLGRQFSGDSASYVKKTYHVPYTMTIQVRDRGEHGILFANTEIEPACEDISSSITALMVNSGQYRPYQNKGEENRVDFLVLLYSLIFIILIK